MKLGWFSELDARAANVLRRLCRTHGAQPRVRTNRSYLNPDRQKWQVSSSILVR